MDFDNVLYAAFHIGIGLVLFLAIIIIVPLCMGLYVSANAPTVEEEISEEQFVSETQTELVKTDVIYDVPLSDKLQIYTQEKCKEYAVEYELVLAVIQVESRYNENAYNVNSGCIGLMQINPINLPHLKAELLIEDIKNPYENILSGIYLLSKCFTPYDGITSTETMALMMYNLGKTGAISLMQKGCYETSYTRKVLEAKENLTVREKIYYYTEVIENER